MFNHENKKSSAFKSVFNNIKDNLKNKKLDGFIKKNVHQKSQVKAPIEDSIFTIFTAVRNKDIEMAKFILDKGVNIDDKCRKTNNMTYTSLPEGMEDQPYSKANHTALFYAAEIGDKAMVEFLLKKGANPNISGGGNANPLHIASAKGHTEVIKLLLKYKAKIDDQDTFGNAALFYAVMNKHYDAVDCLINAGADVHIVNNQDNTYLHAAAEVVDKKILKQFVDLGVDVKAVNKNGETALYIVVPDMEALQSIAFQAQYDMAEILLNSGSKTDDQIYKNGDSAMMRAGEHGHSSFLRLFLSHGADVDIEMDDATTPLISVLKHYPSTNNKQFLDSVKILLDNGADVNATNSSGWTALQYACFWRKTDMVELLFKNDADPNIYAFSNISPLSMAIEKKSLEMVKILLENGADIKHQVCSGQTMVELAKEQSNNDDIVKYLRNYLKEQRSSDKELMKKRSEKKQNIQKKIRQNFRKMHSKRKPLGSDPR